MVVEYLRINWFKIMGRATEALYYFQAEKLDHEDYHNIPSHSKELKSARLKHLYFMRKHGIEKIKKNCNKEQD